MRLRFFLSLLALLVLSTPADAETCVLTGTGTLQCPTNTAAAACTKTGVTVTGCGTDGSTMDNSDIFDIQGTVTANGNLYGQGALQVFKVSTGGDLLCRVADGCNIITFGYDNSGGRASDGFATMTNGLVATGAGSTITLQGSYLSPTAATFSATKPTTHFYAGDVLPCGATTACDTSTNNTLMRIQWNVNKHDEAKGTDGDTVIDTALAAIDPAKGDVICWRDPNEADDVAATDSPFCYRITGASGTGPNYYLEFDVRQGAIDRVGMLLAERNLAKCTVDLATGAASPYRDKITFTTADNTSCAALLTADGIAEGWAYVRVGRASQDPGRPFKITRVDDESPGAGQTTVTIFPPLDRGLADNETVEIDYGWMPGDAFWILRPVHVSDARLAALSTPITDTQATQQDQAGNVRVDAGGELTMSATWIDRVYSTTATASGLYGTLEDVWFSDATSREQGTSGVVLGFEGINADDVTLHRLAISGGPSQSCRTAPTANACQHGLNLSGGGLLVASEIGVRHNGDDGVVRGSTSRWNVRHYVAQSGARLQSSGSCIEFSGTGTVDGIACMDEMAAGASAFEVGASGTGEIRDSLSLGGGQGFPVIQSPSSTLRFKNYVSLANDSDLTETVPVTRLPRYVTGFWVQDMQFMNGSGSIRWMSSSNEDVIEMRDGVLVDLRIPYSGATTLAFTPASPTLATVMSNVAMVDIRNTGAVAHTLMSRSSVAGQNTLLDHLAFVVRAKGITAATNKILSAAGTAAGTVIFKDLLFSGTLGNYGGNPSWEEVGGGVPSMSTRGDMCFYTYTLDGAQALDHYSAVIDGFLDTMEAGGLGQRHRDRDPQFVDEFAYFPRVDTKPGSPCGNAGVKRGAQAPGVKYNWPLSKIHGVSLKMDDTLGRAVGMRRAQ